ncbi:porin family protein [Mesorhizobium sp. VK23B]|uniref:Porin family protein n=1 Tax=Mesorhizobium dulcispinae TaxID=3072316 RepID=A0ABU4X9B0_9HYPH|nr:MULTISPECIES: outer membrane protein [unclassified Mesorhizobium]MDX8465806.1 porin family protein [Mesorhizobium sp. VK23B]MDX8471392.1 porin family protein [Mesorhizobium sp. VK23A]MDX8519099.1 porin family protein [Mesorhizobium sp. VK23D]
MFSKSRIALALAAIVLMPATQAVSADYNPPIYVDEAPDYQPVEVGSGWYLRGDIGYAFSHPYENSSNIPGFSSSRTLFDASVGMGYHFNDYLRADLNLGILPSNKFGDSVDTTCAGSTTTTTVDNTSGTITSQLTAPDTRPCNGSSNALNKAYSLMANGYVDLGTYVGITPYIGAGAGVVYDKYASAIGAKNCVPSTSSVVSNGNTITTQFNCDDPAGYDGQVSSKARYDFAYSLAAGLSYQVTKNVSVDLGYEYLSIPSAQYVAYDNGLFNVHKGVNFQTVKLGLRYDLW